MLEWYRSGYFRPSLLVRRGCDERFSQLGELERLWERVPFAPGLSAPPITVGDRCPTRLTFAYSRGVELARLFLYIFSPSKFCSRVDSCLTNVSLCMAPELRYQRASLLPTG